MRVVHLTLSLARGGRRTAIFSLIEGLRTIGTESAICCVEELGCSQQEAAQAGVPVDVLGRRVLFDRPALRKFRDFCHRVKPDVIHAHDAGSQVTAALARLGMKKIPLLMTFHRSRSNETAKFGHRVRNSIACLQCGAIVTGSRERREHFLSRNFVPTRKVIQIPFGTDLARFFPDPECRKAVRQELGIADNQILVGTIGHFGPEKGVDIAIRAFQAFLRRSPNSPAVLVIFGEGDRRPEMEALAAQYGPPGSIRFAGFRSDIDRCMRGLDLLLHAPRLEAFGLVIIEAMATALPVVASRIGGIPDLVRQGTTGLLAKPEDPESLAACLEQLLHNPTFVESMGAEARRVALAEYGLDLYARRYAALYEDLAAHRPPNPRLLDIQTTL